MTFLDAAIYIVGKIYLYVFAMSNVKVVNLSGAEVAFAVKRMVETIGVGRR